MPVPMIDSPYPETVRTQFVAWMDGARGRLSGLVVPDCPHPPRSAAGDAWENGWDVVNHYLEQSGPTREEMLLKNVTKRLNSHKTFLPEAIEKYPSSVRPIYERIDELQMCLSESGFVEEDGKWQ